ncbi:MAG: hypothetical protein JXB49_06070 [Bacteroidales bacterium]|nr:hypothetical protein [Bacteroidales bacterium]
MNKHLIYYLLTFFLVFTACNQKEIDQLNLDKQSLAEENAKRDSVINDMLYSFNEIQANLQVIKDKQSIISVNANEEVRSDNTVDQINSDLQMINDLMDENNKTIASLRRKLKNSNAKIDELEKMLDMTLKQLEEKDVEISQLKQELISLNIKIEVLSASIDTLKQEGAAKDAVIEEKTTELNTAYYAMGTKKELLENNIITKEGGFAGLGKSQKLSQDFNAGYFTKIDIRKKVQITIGAKKYTIVTSHPSTSYKVNMKDDIAENIEITDPAAFWKASKYLVIIID